ncbi:hypothetical protein PVAP13_9KG571201 [Panicum virgatum]|uniref:KIB1-4 beta-propeller domain-containing protein n=1 Tax=Panicum virgatum TaxID=38727 RepID=A0A8T0P231_PANVG|nr:hypothetical protein PVAP13_9KG571201 [Panicum virgatum]
MQPLGGTTMSFALTWKQGWILNSSSDRNNPFTFLHDPRTLNRIELPNFPHPLPRVFQCALSDKPTSTAGCVVVILRLNEPCFWYCRVGVTPEWIKHDYDVGSQQCDIEGLVWEKRVITDLTSCKGKFYFYIAAGDYVILEFNPSPVTQIIKMQGVPRRFGTAETCSFELDEEHYKFFAFHDYKDGALNITGITLYKIDLIGQRFVKVDKIGDRALLWSGYGGGCCPATRFALEPNCVYWTGPNAMHIFNIVENTHRVCYHPSNDLPKLSSEAFWLLPV